MAHVINTGCASADGITVSCGAESRRGGFIKVRPYGRGERAGNNILDLETDHIARKVAECHSVPVKCVTHKGVQIKGGIRVLKRFTHQNRVVINISSPRQIRAY